MYLPMCLRSLRSPARRPHETHRGADAEFRLRRAVSWLGPLLALAAAALPLGVAIAGDQPSRRVEPRLILPGGHALRAGQLVDLRWAPADSVSELEILLSDDGGRTYARCISPRLDPRRCDFMWRVPRGSRQPLLMRIRFNRGGREIEGAPAAPLDVSNGEPDRAIPLGLPPLDESPLRPTNGRGEASGSASRGGVEADATDTFRHAPDADASRAPAIDTAQAATPRATRATSSEIRFVPLRA